MIRRSPVNRSTKSIARRAVRRSNPDRKRRDFARAYHSVERVEFVKARPCAACGVLGYTENAHVPPKGEAGTSYKAHYRFIAPLCGPQPIFGEDPPLYMGCHTLHGKHREIFNERYPAFNAEEVTADTERRWQEANQPRSEAQAV